MKKYKTLILLLILCMVVCIFAGTTYAWFVKVKRTGAVYFKTGEVEYSIDSEGFDNNFTKKQYVVPGDDLVLEDEYLYFVNHSSISSSVRILFRAVINGTPYVIGEENNGLIYTMMSAENNYKWEFNNGYWYYKNYTQNSEGAYEYTEFIPQIAVGSTGAEMPVCESIILDGAVFGNSIATEDIVIEIYFQAKQADYADWASIGDVKTTLG